MNFEFLEKFFKPKQENDRRLADDEADKIISEKINIDAISQKLRTNFEMSNEQVIKSLARLCLELKNKAVKYDTILGDDASGRIVSLFLKQIIDKKRSEQKKPLTKIYFLPGRYKHDDDDDYGLPDLPYNSYSPIEKFIESKKYEMKKTLVATEYIQTGYTIRRIVDILEDAGVNFDIAALSIKFRPGRYDPRIGERLTYGGVDEVGRTAFYKADFLGVKKESAVKDDSYIYDKLARDKRADPGGIRMARQDIKILAQELSPLLEN